MGDWRAAGKQERLPWWQATYSAALAALGRSSHCFKARKTLKIKIKITKQVVFTPCNRVCLSVSWWMGELRLKAMFFLTGSAFPIRDRHGS